MPASCDPVVPALSRSWYFLSLPALVRDCASCSVCQVALRWAEPFPGWRPASSEHIHSSSPDLAAAPLFVNVELVNSDAANLLCVSAPTSFPPAFNTLCPSSPLCAEAGCKDDSDICRHFCFPYAVSIFVAIQCLFLWLDVTKPSPSGFGSPWS